MGVGGQRNHPGTNYQLDGKCLRGSNDQQLSQRAMDMVSAWATENEIAVGGTAQSGRTGE